MGSSFDIVSGSMMSSRALVLLTCAVLFAPLASAEETKRVFGLGGEAGVAIDRGGFQAGVTARLAISPRFVAGLSAEWSPWFDLLNGRFTGGTINGYASIGIKWFGTETVAVRSLLHLGVSVLLFEPIGARVGSIGPFAGLSLLSVSIQLSPKWTFELTPDVTLSIPSLSGVPLVYRQYRLMVSLIHWFG